ncbi:hypothetical protein PVAP13_1NG149076 [Panicum virgatum]|uniref:Uncharacterized protein n=1 Tax=Panicum virgatum TaxID=38727 RepID=A0A8T0WYH8_PANVG|nr:hypothetical protein PVAP13_1NG149076 [Panicum virgatum]
MDSLTPFRMGFVVIVDMLLVLLVLVHDMLLMMLLLDLLLDLRETVAFLLVVEPVLLLDWLFRGRFPRVFQVLLIQTSICIMLTLMLQVNNMGNLLLTLFLQVTSLPIVS